MKKGNEKEIVRWEPIIKELKKLVLSENPIIAGHIHPGEDLDLLVILDENHGDMQGYINFLELLQSSANIIDSNLLFFRTFTSTPYLLSQTKDKPHLYIHSMIYPDLNSFLAWEKHIIIKSLLSNMIIWTNNNESIRNLINIIRPEPIIARINTYRSMLYDGIHIAQFEMPDPLTSARDLKRRLFYVTRFGLYEKMIRDGFNDNMLLNINAIICEAKNQGYDKMIEILTYNSSDEVQVDSLLNQALCVDKFLVSFIRDLEGKSDDESEKSIR